MQRSELQSLSKFTDISKSAMLFLSPVAHSDFSQSGQLSCTRFAWGLHIRSMRAFAARRRLPCKGPQHGETNQQTQKPLH